MAELLSVANPEKSGHKGTPKIAGLRLWLHLVGAGLLAAASYGGWLGLNESRPTLDWQPIAPTTVSSDASKGLLAEARGLAAAIRVAHSEHAKVGESLQELVPRYIPKVPARGWLLDGYSLRASQVTKEECDSIGGLLPDDSGTAGLQCVAHPATGKATIVYRLEELRKEDKGGWYFGLSARQRDDGIMHVKLMSSGTFVDACPEQADGTRDWRIGRGETITAGLCIPAWKGQPAAVLAGLTLMEGGQATEIQIISGGKKRAIAVGAAMDNCGEATTGVVVVSLLSTGGTIRAVQIPRQCGLDLDIPTLPQKSYQPITSQGINAGRTVPKV